MFFEEFDAQKNKKEKKFGNRRPLSDLDFGSLRMPRGVHCFLWILLVFFLVFLGEGGWELLDPLIEDDVQRCGYLSTAL